MVRKRQAHTDGQEQQVVQEMDPVLEAIQPLQPATHHVPGGQRFIAFLLFFVVAVPLIMFILALAYQLWEILRGNSWVLDFWTTVVVLPLCLLVTPVFFYLGWHFQARAKNQNFDLEKAMGGRFSAFCRTVYGILAGITILLAMIGVLGSAFIDSSLILVTWVGTAFVGIGIISWLFQDTSGETELASSQTVSLRPTGFVFILFSVVWLYVCVVALFDQDWKQLEGGIALFLLFLIIGIVAVRLSDRQQSSRTKASRDGSDLIV